MHNLCAKDNLMFLKYDSSNFYIEVLGNRHFFVCECLNILTNKYYSYYSKMGGETCGYLRKAFHICIIQYLVQSIIASTKLWMNHSRGLLAFLCDSLIVLSCGEEKLYISQVEHLHRKMGFII